MPSRKQPASRVRKKAITAKVRRTTTRRAPMKKKPATRQKPSTHKRAQTRMRAHSPIVASRKERSSGLGVLWGLAILLLVILGYVISLSMSTASVEVTLKEQRVPVELSLELFEDGVQDQLDFDTVTFTVSAEAAVAATEFEAVEERAFGSITIFNNHSTRPQRLLEETRFESADGKIYKLGKGAGLTVPGQTEVDGELVPGSIEAIVYAADPGADYNSSPTDFVIPGFRGGPKFEGFYARSTTPLEGGVVTERPVLDEVELLRMSDKLQEEIQRKSGNDITYQIPEGYMVLSGSEQYVWGEITYQDGVDEGSVIAEQSAEISVTLVRTQEFTESVLLGSGFEDAANIEITNLDTLDYMLSDLSEGMLTVSIAGNANARWFIDESEVKRIIENVKKKEFAEALAGREEVQSVRAEVKPLWASRLPKKKDNIQVFFTNIDS